MDQMINELPDNELEQVKSEENSEKIEEVNKLISSENEKIENESISINKQEENINTKKQNKTCLVILTIAVIFAFLIGIFQFCSNKGSSYTSTVKISPFSNFSFNLSSISSKPYIAVVHIEGTIEDKNETYDQEWLLNTIDDLASDKNNKGILLFINSGGGGVYQSDEVYLELLTYKETEKPVWAYLGPMAASGGYYIACAADEIQANRNTLTGSIGVISGQSVDLSVFLEKTGIKINTFIAGRNKDMLNINTPVTPEQRQIMQSIADECYNQFTGIVAESRNLPLDKVVKLADGRIYTAQQALDLGLIDSINRFSDTVYDMTDLIESLENIDLEINHYYPEKETNFYDLFFSVATNIKNMFVKTDENSILLETATKAIPNIPFPAYYFHQ